MIATFSELEPRGRPALAVGTSSPRKHSHLHYMKKTILCSLCLAVSLLATQISSAQVMIGDIQTAVAPGSNPIDNPSVSFDVNGTTTTNSVVGVFIGLQDYNAASITSVTLDGVAMTQGITLFNAADIWGAFYYLPTQEVGANTISVTTSASTGNRRGMTVQGVVLNNVNASVAPLVASDTTLDGGTTLADKTLSLGLTTTGTGNAILGFGMADSNHTVTSNYFGSIDILANQGFADQLANVGSGSQNVDFIVERTTGTSDNAVGMAASFAVIPEPATSLLLLSGLALLVVAPRRRLA